MIGCTVLFAIACAIAAIPFLKTKPLPPRPPTIPYANPAKPEHPSSAIAERQKKAERRKELQHKIGERLDALGAYAKDSSDIMDEYFDETDRLFEATNEAERAAISARIKILDSELAEHVRFYTATTNEVEKLKAELDSLSDSAANLQVTK